MDIHVFKIFKGFDFSIYGHGGSCDYVHSYELILPLTKEAPYEIWHWLVKQIQDIIVTCMYKAQVQGQITA